MEEKRENCFAEHIGGVTFTVNVHSAQKAKQTADEFIKALITKESSAFEGDGVGGNARLTA